VRAGISGCKRVRFTLLAALLWPLCFCVTAAHADTPSVSGSLYKLRLGDKNSAAVVGASAYVHPVGDASSPWIGPNLTDRFGRFVFYNLPSGAYVIRIFSSTIRLWQQTLNVNPEAKLGSIVIPDVRLVYFTKTSDPPNIAEALSDVQLPYDSEPGKRKDDPSNTIWFGDDVTPAQVKKVAMALLGAHASLRAIRKFSVSNDWHAKIIEVGSTPGLTSGKVLTPADVDRDDFPRASGKSEDQL